MEIKRISPFLSVSPQIYAAHVERLATQGFKTIINNRPDNETDDQPLVEELIREAAKHGIEFINIPVIPGELTQQNVKEFGDAMSRVQGTGAGLLPIRDALDQSMGALRGQAYGFGCHHQFCLDIGYDLSWQKEHLDEALATASRI